MDVAILHPPIPAHATPEDQDTLVQVESVSSTLRCLGHTTWSVPITLDLSATREALVQRRPDVVFNLGESVGGFDSLQFVPAAMLDTLRLPYTGNSAEAIFQTSHKLLGKQLVHLAGLPTPAWMAAETAVGAGVARARAFESADSPADQPCTSLSGMTELRPPCIVKAIWEHASRGIDDRNVILEGDAETVRQRLGEFAQRCGRPCFAEQFIAGREFNVAMLDGPGGPQVLPLGEIDFSAFPPDKPRIVSHAAKWAEGSFEYENTPRYFDFTPGDGALLDQLRRLGLACWRLFSLRGYARLDVRVDSQGRPWILEVNTNPCISPDAGYAAMLARAGICYEEGIRRILEAAVS